MKCISLDNLYSKICQKKQFMQKHCFSFANLYQYASKIRNIYKNGSLVKNVLIIMLHDVD